MSLWIIRLICAAALVQTACADVPVAPKKDNKALFAKWAKIKDPTTGPTNPIGTYAAGCLAGALKMDQESAGYTIMKPSRNRYYAHPAMMSYLNTLSDTLHHAKMPYLLIGDISPPRGGPMNNGHNSHQIGLDVDLWLRMSGTRPTMANRESWSATNYVIARKKLKDNWSSRQVQLVSTAANFPEVARIFVSPAIKKYFCEHFNDAPWLYKLRSWWSHEDHIHVRLNCPADSPHCEPQPALNPHDNSCGSELDWWLSKEADDEWAKMIKDPTERQFPDLPATCEDLVKDVATSPTIESVP